MTAQQQIQTELPSVIQDAAILGAGAVAARVGLDARTQSQTKAGKGKDFDFIPLIVLIVAILLASYFKDRRVRMAMFGIIMYSLLSIIFKSSGGLKGLMGFGATSNATNDQTFITVYDDSHLAGLACLECGGTCGDKQTTVQENLGCGCNPLLGLESYVSSQRLAEIRANCPGLEQLLNAEIEKVLARGDAIVSVVYDPQTCEGTVKWQVKTDSTSPSNGTPTTGGNKDLLSNAPVGATIATGQCANGVITLSLLKKVTSGVFTNVEIDPSNYSKAIISLLDSRGNVLEQSYVFNGQSVQLNIQKSKYPYPTYSSFKGKIEVFSPVNATGGSTSTVYEIAEFACPITVDDYGSVVVKATPTTTTAPPAPPSSTVDPATEVDLLIDCSTMDTFTNFTARLVNRSTGSIVPVNNGGYGSFTLIVQDPNGASLARSETTNGSMQKVFTLPSYQTDRGGTITVQGIKNGVAFSVKRPFRCDNQVAPTPDCDKLLQMGLKPEVAVLLSANTNVNSCANILKQSDVPRYIETLNCEYDFQYQVGNQNSLKDFTVESDGKIYVNLKSGTRINPSLIASIKSIIVAQAGGVNQETVVEVQGVGGGGATAIVFDFGDGTPTQTNSFTGTQGTVRMSHTYRNAGTYTVKASIPNPRCGASEKTIIANVTAVQPPVVNQPADLVALTPVPILPNATICNNAKRTTTTTPPPRTPQDTYVPNNQNGQYLLPVEARQPNCGQQGTCKPCFKTACNSLQRRPARGITTKKNRYNL